MARSTAIWAVRSGLILSYADPVELAKTVSAFKDFGEKFKIRGGVLDGKPLSPAEINELASLPPREVILAQLLGLLQAPATQSGAPVERTGFDRRAVARRVGTQGWRSWAGREWRCAGRQGSGRIGDAGRECGSSASGGSSSGPGRGDPGDAVHHGRAGRHRILKSAVG